MGNQNAGGGGRGLASTLGSVLLDMLNGDSQNAAGDRRTRSQISQCSQRNRPKSWESFEKHQEWQYQEKDEGSQGNEAQQIMADIIAATNRIILDGGWWDVAKGVFAPAGAEKQKEAGSRDGRSKKQSTEGG